MKLLNSQIMDEIDVLLNILSFTNNTEIVKKSLNRLSDIEHEFDIIIISSDLLKGVNVIETN